MKNCFEPVERVGGHLYPSGSGSDAANEIFKHRIREDNSREGQHALHEAANPLLQKDDGPSTSNPSEEGSKQQQREDLAQPRTALENFGKQDALLKNLSYMEDSFNSFFFDRRDGVSISPLSPIPCDTPSLIPRVAPLTILQNPPTTPPDPNQAKASPGSLDICPFPETLTLLPTENCPIRFRLRSRDIPDFSQLTIHIQGLGKNSLLPSKRKGRGSPSHLSTAQNHALQELADGKHKSIFGALRAAKALGGVPQ